MSKGHPFKRKVALVTRQEWNGQIERGVTKPGARLGDSTYGLQYENQWYDDDEVDLMAEGLFETMLLERS